MSSKSVQTKQPKCLLKILPLHVFFNILFYTALAPFGIRTVDDTNGEFGLKRNLIQMV